MSEEEVIEIDLAQLKKMKVGGGARMNLRVARSHTCSAVHV